MGTYTNTLKFYKPAGDEVIDVEQHLNYNWNISDREMKRLLEYEYTTGSAPNVVGALGRSRFYKEYSNSLQAYFTDGSFFYQDPLAFVSPWTMAGSVLQAGWLPHPDNPLAYRTVRKAGGTTTMVEWVGSIVNQWPDPVNIDVNINMTVVDVGGLPGSIVPTVPKYFNQNAGNTTANYSIARIFFANTGAIEMKRYGANPTNPGDENRVDFTGIKYTLEVAA